jgi:chemotaxis protein MotD
MIDLSALGLGAKAQASHHTCKHQNGAHGQAHADDAKSFNDLITAAGKKAGHKNAHQQAGEDAAEDGKSLVNPKLPKIDLRTATVDAPAGTGKDAADEPVAQQQGRVSVPGDLQQFVKGKAEDETADQHAVAALADLADPDPLADKADEKAANTAKTGTKPAAANKDAVSRASDPKPHSDPAQELRAMLEPARDTVGDVHAEDSTDVKPIRKDKTDDRADDIRDAGARDLKADVAADANLAVSRTDTAVVAQVASHQAAAIQTASTNSVDDDETPQSDDTRKIQAVLPDEKLRAADVELSEDKGTASAKSAGGDKPDFVTVLESRRYLGFSSDAPAITNASVLSDAIKADPSLTQAVQDIKAGGAQHATSTEVNTLKLQMSPEHLGNMTASLRLKGEELSVEVRVETVDAYRQLSQDQDGIVKALKDHGFSIDQVSIQLAPSARADSGQTGGNQSQSGSGQQSLQDGSQGDTARQRDDGARRNANQNNWTGNERTALSGDTGNSTDDTRSGNLYL